VEYHGKGEMTGWEIGTCLSKIRTISVFKRIRKGERCLKKKRLGGRKSSEQIVSKQKPLNKRTGPSGVVQNLRKLLLSILGNS